MLHSFVPISPELRDHLQTHTLVTPNERLAREYRRGFELMLLNDPADNIVHRTPQILSLQQYLLSCYEQMCEDLVQPQRLLHQADLIRLAHAAAPADLARSTVANLLDNWNIMLEYGIPLNSSSILFTTWFERMNVLIEASERKPYQLVGRMLKEAGFTPPRPLITVALEALSDAQSEFLSSLCAHGKVRYLDVNSTIKSATQITELLTTRALDAESVRHRSLAQADSLETELRTAARWARATKLQDSQATIGIVVPDLASRHAQIHRIIAQELDPLQGSRTLTFDISGGQALRVQPVWQHARKFLGLALESTTYAALTALWPSPFFNLAQLLGELSPWPRTLSRTCALVEFLHSRKTPTAVELIEVIESFATPQTVQTTMDAIFQSLNLVGWPNNKDLDSTQYQATQQVMQLLSDFREAAHGKSLKQPLEVLRAVDHLLENAMFSAQRAPADIQVLGRLETTGLSFSHLWICGMDALGFPGPASRFSFIPQAIADRHNVPRTTQLRETAFCEQQLANWIAQSGEIKFSYVGHDVDAEIPPSGLLHEPHIRELASTQPNWPRQASELERYTDHRASPLIGQPARTGVTLLKYQAECAFKAWAVFRAEISEQRVPHLIINHLGRGNLVHSMLFHLLTAFRSQTALQGVTDDDIERAIEQGLNELRIPLPDEFRAAEHQRLLGLCKAWLKLEQQRPQFEVLGVEEAFELTIAGLQINVRLDRRDSVAGATVVIDYKTGGESLSGLHSTPLTSVQLPIYAQTGTSENPVSGVFFGLVHERPSWRGISSSELISNATVETDWTQLTHLWRSELDRLAHDFQTGYAEVAPTTPKACEYCHLHSVCRIRQRTAIEL